MLVIKRESLDDEAGFGVPASKKPLLEVFVGTCAKPNEQPSIFVLGKRQPLVLVDVLR